MANQTFTAEDVERARIEGAFDAATRDALLADCAGADQEEE